MHLTIIPYAAIAADRAHVRSLQQTPHPTARSQRFNTARHSRLEILPLIPETSDFTHADPPWAPYGYILWHPLIARSQGLQHSHILPIPSFLHEDLLRCHAAWIRTNHIASDKVNEIVTSWLSTPAGQTLPTLLNGEKGYFLRLDQWSPKDSPFSGPCTSLPHIVARLCTSLRASAVLAHALSTQRAVEIILNPWDKSMTPETEFRVFVPPPAASRKEANVQELAISALSQYAWHTRFSRPHGLDAEQTAITVYNGALNLLAEIKHFLRKDIPHMAERVVEYGFVFDVALRSDGSVVLLEINPFGACSPCGAALFQWVADAGVLYGLEGVVVRLTI